MELGDVDLRFLTGFYHAYSYALSYALSNLMGAGQAIFMHDYAKALDKIFRRGRDSFQKLLAGIDDFIEVLRSKGLVENIVVEDVDRNRIRLVVRGCNLAQLTHHTLGLVGARDYLCPIAAMAMVALARDMGFKEGENIFDYIRFSGSLSTLDEDGSVTEFLVVGRGRRPTEEM